MARRQAFARRAIGPALPRRGARRRPRLWRDRNRSPIEQLQLHAGIARLERVEQGDRISRYPIDSEACHPDRARRCIVRSRQVPLDGDAAASTCWASGTISLPEIGQPIAGGMPDKQMAAHPLLQLRQPPVYGRLAHPQGLCCRNRAAVARHGQECRRSFQSNMTALCTFELGQRNIVASVQPYPPAFSQSIHLRPGGFQ